MHTTVETSLSALAFAKSDLHRLLSKLYQEHVPGAREGTATEQYSVYGGYTNEFLRSRGLVNHPLQSKQVRNSAQTETFQARLTHHFGGANDLSEADLLACRDAVEHMLDAAAAHYCSLPQPADVACGQIRWPAKASAFFTDGGKSLRIEITSVMLRLHQSQRMAG